MELLSERRDRTRRRTPADEGRQIVRFLYRFTEHLPSTEDLGDRFSSCVKITFMGIPNVRRFRISSPDGGQTATVMAVLPKGADVDAYVSDASKRFDWKAYGEAQLKQFKIRVGQQKQKKAK